MEWLNKAKGFFFGQQDEQQGPAAAESSKRKADQKQGWSRGGAPPPPGSTRVVKKAVPPPEPVLLEAEALKRKAGIQGLTWYAHSQKQDTHGDIAVEFLEEGSSTSQLLPQQVKPAPLLAVREVQHGNVVLMKAKKVKASS